MGSSYPNSTALLIAVAVAPAIWGTVYLGLMLASWRPSPWLESLAPLRGIWLIRLLSEAAASLLAGTLFLPLA